MANFDFHELGKALKAQAEGKKITELCKEMGINRMTFYRILRGDVLTLKNVIKIMKYLEKGGYKFDDFLK